ncbi:hypothetical protein [Gallaecimonas pentaromativorans]|uniref:hypothetical protein n=1 Tax=Gallaecimonas pentaromativorans TaxID=584787 RepID=UPI003A92AFD7
MARNAGRALYMTHDTALYKAFNQGTQMSDFLVRYTLYNHMTTRQKNRVAHDEAIQRASDMFVNYDVPTSRGLQYLNDMGAVMFTKYFLRIQRSLFQIFREQPARTLSLMSAESMLKSAPTMMDSTLVNKLTGGGPIMADGALGWFQSLDDIFTINMALRPFN